MSDRYRSVTWLMLKDNNLYVTLRYVLIYVNFTLCICATICLYFFTLDDIIQLKDMEINDTVLGVLRLFVCFSLSIALYTGFYSSLSESTMLLRHYLILSTGVMLLFPALIACYVSFASPYHLIGGSHFTAKAMIFGDVSSASHPINRIQLHYECCTWNDPYSGSFVGGKRGLYPRSCCKPTDKEKNCTSDSIDFHKISCKESMNKYWKKVMPFAISLALLIAILNAPTILVATVLTLKITGIERRVKRDSFVGKIYTKSTTVTRA